MQFFYLRLGLDEDDLVRDWSLQHKKKGDNSPNDGIEAKPSGPPLFDDSWKTTG